MLNLHLIYTIILASILVIASSFVYDQKKLLISTTVGMTCVGTFQHPLATDVTFNQYSAWVQDPPNQLLRFDIGLPGQLEFVQMYFNSTGGYLVVTPKNDQNLFCQKVATKFSDVIGAYTYPYVRYMGDTTWNGKAVGMYGGISPDPVTKTDISNVGMFGPNGEYYGMTILSNNGFIYYDYPNVTLGTPAASWFTVPSVCNGATIAPAPTPKTTGSTFIQNLIANLIILLALILF